MKPILALALWTTYVIWVYTFSYNILGCTDSQMTFWLVQILRWHFGLYIFSADIWGCTYSHRIFWVGHFLILSDDIFSCTYSHILTCTYSQESGNILVYDIMLPMVLFIVTLLFYYYILCRSQYSTWWVTFICNIYVSHRFWL